MKLTQELVKQYFEHREGELYWKIRIAHRVQIGDLVGTFSKTTGYRRVNLTVGGPQAIHRLVFLWHHGYLPERVDHINRNKLDNRIENLRPCSISQNGANSNLRKDNTSGYRGVSFCKRDSNWQAQIWVNQVKLYLGKFKTKEEAASAYNLAAVYHYKEFALLNEVLY